MDIIPVQSDDHLLAARQLFWSTPSGWASISASRASSKSLMAFPAITLRLMVGCYWPSMAINPLDAWRSGSWAMASAK